MSKVDLNTNKALLEKARDSVITTSTERQAPIFTIRFYTFIYRYVIFGYADSGKSDSLEVQEEEEVSKEERDPSFHSGRPG